MSKIVGKPRSAFIDLHPAKPSPKPIAYKFRPAISEVKRVSLALQGGSAHGAFTWGVLDRLLEEPRIEVEGVSATSAGAMNAAVCPHNISLVPPALLAVMTRSGLVGYSCARGAGMKAITLRSAKPVRIQFGKIFICKPAARWSVKL